jgi:hypothetical protein
MVAQSVVGAEGMRILHGHPTHNAGFQFQNLRFLEMADVADFVQTYDAK